MTRWILTGRIDPAAIPGVVSGRFGASAMFVAYDRLRAQWMWIYPGGEEKIAEPQMLFLDENWAREHPGKKSRGRRENPLAIRRQKSEQLVFDLCLGMHSQPSIRRSGEID